MPNLLLNQLSDIELLQESCEVECKLAAGEKNVIHKESA